MLRLGSWSNSGIRTFRRCALDAVIGFALFVALAFGLTIDRTGGVGGFSDIGRFVSTHAVAAEYVSKANRDGSSALASIKGGVNRAARSDAGVAEVDMAFARMDQTTALILLGLIFSTVIAFKLAFLRHLRAVYSASARRQYGRL